MTRKCGFNEMAHVGSLVHHASPSYSLGPLGQQLHNWGRMALVLDGFFCMVQPRFSSLQTEVVNWQSIVGFSISTD